MVELDNEIHNIIHSAINALEEPAPWQALLLRFNISAAEEGEKLQASQFNHKKGALPIELRRMLQGLQNHYRAKLHRLRHDIDNLNPEQFDVALELVGEAEEKLKLFIDPTVKTYIEQIRPKITIQSIFANAMSSSIKQQNSAEHVHSKTCACCGAARPNKTNLKMCAYCGSPFFSEPRS